MNSIWVGFDKREGTAFGVARDTIKRKLTQQIPVYGLLLEDLKRRGLYTRPTEYRPSALDKPVMWDVISDAPMSTEHANARFLVPHLANLVFNGEADWAVFLDGDTMALGNLARLFKLLDASKAVYCVHHNHQPTTTTKMDGQVQTSYNRKNWTSVMALNCRHPSVKALTPDVVNTLPGRDLHRFCWLKDEEIGELDPSWNFLVGHSDPTIKPNIVHFTDGVPDMPGYENVPYADEWREAVNDWARGSLSLPG